MVHSVRKKLCVWLEPASPRVPGFVTVGVAADTFKLEGVETHYCLGGLLLRRPCYSGHRGAAGTEARRRSGSAEDFGWPRS